ncbi:hypothetical protein TcWFU_007640 [Taenia crassiceps]|uniref:Uncharacterized protein n=1 Tax=Taenia crassiceps TaxID=6207 RepID=A0ABR4PZX9_9CEST
MSIAKRCSPLASVAKKQSVDDYPHGCGVPWGGDHCCRSRLHANTMGMHTGSNEEEVGDSAHQQWCVRRDANQLPLRQQPFQLTCGAAIFFFQPLPNAVHLSG